MASIATAAKQSAVTQDMLDRDLNECLTVELGWKDVAQGISKILIGYGVWIGGNVFGLLLVLMPLIQSGFKLNSARFGIEQMWMFYGGLGVLSVVGIIGFGIIMGGKWKCLLHAPERNGCRWQLFLCMACLAMSAALSILSTISGTKVQPEFTRGVAGLAQVRFTTAGVIFNLASVGLSMAYTCTFALFLRAIAKCMDSRWHVRMVDLFLSFVVPLTVASVLLAIKLATGDWSIAKMLIPVGAGWFLCFIYWFAMMFLLRSCIRKTLERVRDPIAYSALKANAPKRRFA